ncbi:MAG TPA: hypothetical protein VGO58_18025 [Chitinophagaceae bacterium]|jgi:hypothetical protein|nr:hypothetical protein [Chitinophagaceae bacterium]
MRKTGLFFLIPLLFLRSIPLFAQPGVLKGNTVETVTNNFIHSLKAVSADSVIILRLANYFESEMNSIHIFIRDDARLTAIEKDKAVRSLVYFMRELSENLARRNLGIYDIPGAIHSYRNVLLAVLSDKPLNPVLERAGPQGSQLMASVFSQYQQYDLLSDIAVYKRMASSPEFILQFLEKKPGFRFTDSLLLDAAANDPLRIVYYLNTTLPGVQDRIRNTTNIYLKEIALLSGDKHASELLPFVIQIADKKLTREEILGKRTEVPAYFQLLVNTLQESIVSGDPDPVFLKPLRNGIKQKALSFYVNEVNDRHSEPEPARFSSIKALRPQDIYYTITSCGEELYTSSYLGLYKRMMQHFKEGPVDSLFDIVQYDNLRIFLRLAANYNVLDDFLHRLSAEKRKEILWRFIGGIEKAESNALEKAMDIADAFVSLSPGSDGSELIEAELQSNLIRCTDSQNYLGIRLYSILSDIFNLVKQKNGLGKLWATLGDYEVLKHTALENEKGEIVELVLFYGDEDGVISCNNFLRLYGDRSKWEVTKNANWVSIRSLSGQPLTIYANLPLDIRQEMDVSAQDSLVAFLKEHSLEPTVLVHRGHSYHLDKTMKRLTPSVKLAILGSCGGYNRAISIAGINPDVQVIGSKKTGAGSINDPIIEEINKILVDNKDLYWPDTWKNLSNRFGKEGKLSLFNEYFPPANNLGLFVLKLFKYYNRSM